ncbi:hypothetical protein WN55_02280 [Dufourea novaeangliae]|uniref:Uncharacterized protein n=1 Tax=Dufourea novaeangliae TaxID=178035 RepID=A0A154PG18_DUFNO|nr:hypothetical protein WN55_02280 [Dufourea novaeangliae]
MYLLIHKLTVSEEYHEGTIYKQLDFVMLQIEPTQIESFEMRKCTALSFLQCPINSDRIKIAYIEENKVK